MNGYHRHAKYRQGVYRRRQTRTVLLTALVVLLLLFVALLVALCIGWRVWKTATARPAEEICKG